MGQIVTNPKLLATIRDHERFPYRESDVIPCEICEKPVNFKDAYSLAVVYRMPGNHAAIQNTKRSSYQCGHLQHFGCSHEHAMLAVIHCLFEHIHSGPHETSGSLFEHDKLQRIIAILDEPYRDDDGSEEIIEGDM